MNNDRKPVWIAFPTIPWGSIGWRMGPGEDYWHNWFKWFNGLSVQEQGSYQTVWPEPEGWSGFYEFARTSKPPSWFFEQQRLTAEAAQPPGPEEHTIASITASCGSSEST